MFFLLLFILFLELTNFRSIVEDETRLDEPKSASERLQELRDLMKDNSIVGETIDAYIITNVDSHQVRQLNFELLSIQM